MKYIVCFCFFYSVFGICAAQNNPDAILGKWESDEKNLIVFVYKQQNDFKAKIMWFRDPVDTTPIDKRMDVKNPDKNLHTRKLIGMDVLSGLQYNAKQNKWVNGKIYDSTSGRTWDATVWLSSTDNLHVRGYYIVKILGKTLNFHKIAS